MQETLLNTSQSAANDQIEKSLRSIAQSVIAAIFGLMPLVLIPLSYVPLIYGKTILAIVAVLIALIFFSLSVLRAGTLKFSLPLALVVYWGFVAVLVCSALLSGDIRDALVGDTIGVNTVGFSLLMAMIMTVMVFFGQSKSSIMRIYMLLSFSAIVLTVFHVLRLFFGADFLSLGLFNNVVESPVGGWNQLGLFFGLVILLSLVALEQLPLTASGKFMFSVVIVLSLLMLMVVNFVAIWFVLALVSLVVLMYGLTKERFSKKLSPQSISSTSLSSVVVSVSVFVVSLTFIIGGSSIGGFIGEKTGVNYVEVRPSVVATLDLARDVYRENAFVGIGPNKFSDAWRLYKDPSINQTVFWNTAFQSGSGYLPTVFVTTGIFGTVAFLIFFFLFLRVGFKMLFQNQTGDQFWYFIASSSFVASVYLWGMSFVYVSGVAVLLLAAIFTGVSLVAYTSLVPVKTITFSALNNKRTAIVFVGVVMLVIVASASSIYFVTQHYSSVASFNKALAMIGPGMSVEEVEGKIANSYNTSENDRYAREIAQYQVAKMNSLLSLREPTPEQQQQFQQASANGVSAAQLAVQKDSTDPRNHATLGIIYSLLAVAGVTDVTDRALASFAEARKYDPVNPEYLLLEAQLQYGVGNAEKARQLAVDAINLKPNYSEALFFLTQIDIAAGNVDGAIAAAESIVSLERNNAARHYQLGVLYSSAGRVDDAARSFEQAVAIDKDYANARYFLALAYVEQGRVEEAINQFEIVRDLNPDNAIVQSAIDQLKNGTLESVPVVSDNAPIANDVVNQEGNTVTTTVAPDSELISTVNAVPDAEETTNP